MEAEVEAQGQGHGAAGQPRAKRGGYRQLYFGYGSNLWREQMAKRCPHSPYVSIARVCGYRWLINERGYANIVPIDDDDEDGGKSAAVSTRDDENGDDGDDDDDEDYSNQVWGLVYDLSVEDEARLDVNEGVPEAYVKEIVPVELMTRRGESGHGDWSSEEMMMLVYIDHKRVRPHAPKEEYVFRMNMGIKDALREGVPMGYVDSVLRKFIPEVEDSSIEGFARKQALRFEDENA